MGIKKFHQWLKLTYEDAILDDDKSSYDHIYIDLNFILHRLISYVKTEEELLERVLNTIISIITTKNPTKSINLAADGSASYAKIVTQRKHRMQMAEKPINGLNPLCLTAGTEFMNQFDLFLENQIHNVVKKLGFDKIKINLNLSKQPDESEFKICRLIRENTQTIEDTHLIFSHDADIVLIAMALNGIYGIEIIIQCREEKYIISIDDLIEQQMELYGYHMNKRLDFVFISLLNGNDYFPKLKLSSFKKLWKAYKMAVFANETIIGDDGEINFKILIKFLVALNKLIPKRYDDIELKDICNRNIYEYLYGLQWCLKLYSTGEYMSYDYIYVGESIHPMALFLYLVGKLEEKIEFPIEKYEKIPSDIYTILVTPYSMKYLIPKKYHQIVETKLKYIYDDKITDDIRNQLKKTVEVLMKNK